RHNARRPLEEVAAETGVSLRTVKRRLEKMSRERAFDVTGNIALERAPRPIPLAVLFHFTPEGGKATATALLRAFDDRCLTAWVPPSAELGHYDMMLYAESTGEIESIRARAEAVPGVARVEILLYTGAKMDESWLDREIDRRLEPALRA
ncbi:MAG TPA: AsnC family protein, partial [Candidatus Thermoplasmatota archaeon]|nr:AsnC family protein [Candidatus Thermoplasmatota archaeon]